MANTYKGKIEAIEGIQFIQREGKEPFQKRRLMLDVSRFDSMTGEKREKHIIFDFNGKNAILPESYKVGDYVEVAFDVESYKANKKDGTTGWFTSVSGYKITAIGVYQSKPATQEAQTQVQTSAPVQPTPTQAPAQAASDCPF